MRVELKPQDSMSLEAESDRETKYAIGIPTGRAMSRSQQEIGTNGTGIRNRKTDPNLEPILTEAAAASGTIGVGDEKEFIVHNRDRRTRPPNGQVVVDAWTKSKAGRSDAGF